MREKARDFIYLDTSRYISLESLKALYWGTSIIPAFMAVMGISSIKYKEVNWRSLFPLISIAAWSLLFWIFILTIQNKRIKKSFELRFLVNGVSGLFISALFWLFFASFNLLADKPLVDFDICLWMIPTYVLVSLIFIMLILIGVHKGVYGKIREKGQTGTALAITAFFSASLPLAGLVGRLTAKLLRESTSMGIQAAVGIASFVLLIFIPTLANINFVQYFYCKKYNIDCDEYGDTTSQRLVPKKKTMQKALPGKKSKKKMSVPLKILLIVISIPVSFFVVLFIIGFIKAVVENT